MRTSRWAGFEHEIVDAAAQKTAAQAALDATCDGRRRRSRARRTPARQRIDQSGRFRRRHARDRARGRLVQGDRRRLSARRRAAESRPRVCRIGRSRESARDDAIRRCKAAEADRRRQAARARAQRSRVHAQRARRVRARDRRVSQDARYAARRIRIRWPRRSRGSISASHTASSATASRRWPRTRRARRSRRRSIAGRASPKSRSIAATICSTAARPPTRNHVQARARNRQRARARAPARRSVARARPLRRWPRSDWDSRAHAVRVGARRAASHAADASTNRSSMRCSAISKIASAISTAARANYDKALELARRPTIRPGRRWPMRASRASPSRPAISMRRARDIEQAIALIESERTRISAPDLRTSYFGTKRSYYALYIDILMQARSTRPDTVTRALVVAERARARELQDQLAERAIEVDSDVDPEADRRRARRRRRAARARVSAFAGADDDTTRHARRCSRASTRRAARSTPRAAISARRIRATPS